MPRVLTVDDSRAIRAVVGRELVSLGCDYDEAEDGLQGLAKLEELVYDLIILDVTMPNLDGPGFLAKLRETGNQTPVLMLTSESKRSIVVEVMKLKIEDYILKPFKPEELRAKVVKALKVTDTAAQDGGARLSGSAGNAGPGHHPSETVARPAAPPMLAPGEGLALGAARLFGDILVVDDIENVSKRLRSLVPPHLSLFGVTNGQAGLALCRERAFRVVLIDRELPDMNSVALLRQIRVLQPSAACLALTLRSASDLRQEVKDDGFDDVVYKPFTPDMMDEFLEQFFDASEPVNVDGSLVSAPAYTGREDKVERYYGRIGGALKEAVGKVAVACFERVIFDATRLPEQETRNAQLIQALQQHADKVGLGVAIVAGPSLTKTLKGFTETASIPMFATLGDARRLSE
jgi:two-component system cell cycle response regulator